MFQARKNKEEIERIKLELLHFAKIFDALEQKVKSLRGLVNRKLGYSELDTRTEKNISPDGLDEVRKLSKNGKNSIWEI